MNTQNLILKNIDIKNIIFIILGGKLKSASKHRKQDQYGGENQVNDVFLFE